jgi:hypothetical protein
MRSRVRLVVQGSRPARKYEVLLFSELDNPACGGAFSKHNLNGEDRSFFWLTFGSASIKGGRIIFETIS